MNSVLQDWVMELPLRKQGTLVAAIRGCDGLAKADPSKQFSRALRREILVPADPEWKQNEPGGFFDSPLPDLDEMIRFASHLDHYPLHFLQHFYCAAEVVAYHHPKQSVREYWNKVYRIIVHGLHLRPEDEDDFHMRLKDGLRPERFR